jgi:uncharacterized oxidoreductase
MQMPTIDHDRLRDAIAAVCAAGGSEAKEARIVSDNLVDANMTGHDSHGIGMIPAYISNLLNGGVTLNAHAEIVVDNGAIVVIDGHSGYGQVIGQEAMAIGIERAQQFGAAVVGLRNAHHIGRIGQWGEQCASAGLVSTHHVNVIGHKAYVAPFGGTDARYVTNPYCAVMPATDNNPATVLDFATSFVAMGKIRVARNKGEPAPEGALIGTDGKPNRDPNIMYSEPLGGALMPFGDHKGYGLALLNEILPAAMTGAVGCRPDTRFDPPKTINNMLSVIIDPLKLVSKARFNSEVDATIAHVKASPAADPAKPVLVPGDPERMTSASRKAEGVPVDDVTWREITESAISVGMTAAALNEIAGLAA